MEMKKYLFAAALVLAASGTMADYADKKQKTFAAAGKCMEEYLSTKGCAAQDVTLPKAPDNILGMPESEREAALTALNRAEQEFQRNYWNISGKYYEHACVSKIEGREFKQKRSTCTKENK